MTTSLLIIILSVICLICLFISPYLALVAGVIGIIWLWLHNLW